jgi:2-phosphoglycerate kinase
MERYKVKHPNTRLFIAGVPLSGKSTITSILCGQIEGISSQNMDIFRILAIEMENLKSEPKRNKFVAKGSCDSYLLIGDGKYTPRALIEGYKKYSQAICTLLSVVVPQLEAQGAQNIVFEGVQLMPSLVQEYLNSNSRLILVLSNQKMLKANAQKRFSNEPELLNRYAPDRLLLLQNEIKRQALTLPSWAVLNVENNKSPDDAARVVLTYLRNEGLIV